MNFWRKRNDEKKRHVYTYVVRCCCPLIPWFQIENIHKQIIVSRHIKQPQFLLSWARSQNQESAKVALHRPIHWSCYGIAAVHPVQLVYILITTSVTYIPFSVLTRREPWNFKHAAIPTYGQNGSRLEAARYCELPHSWNCTRARNRGIFYACKLCYNVRFVGRSRRRLLECIVKGNERYFDRHVAFKILVVFVVTRNYDVSSYVGLNL